MSDGGQSFGLASLSAELGKARSQHAEHNSVLGAARARGRPGLANEAAFRLIGARPITKNSSLVQYPGRMRRFVRFLLIIADCALVLEAFAVLKWRLVDWLYGPAAETSADRAIRERGPRA